MKKNIYELLLILVLFISPAYAEVISLSEPAIKINNLTYMPTHAVQIVNDTFYLSGEDLAAITYGSYEVMPNAECLTLQNQQIVYMPNSSNIEVNSISKQLKVPTITLNNIVYLPVDVLDQVAYPYQLSSDGSTLSIEPLQPYSTSTDHYNEHELLSTTYKDFPQLLSSLLDESAANELIQTARKNKCYISFMSTQNKTKAFQLIADLINHPNKKNLKTTVHFRQLDCSSSLPKLSQFTTLPVTYKMTSEGLNLNIGETNVSNKFFWSTYNPIQQDSISIDLNKSLDAMIIRNLYTYYRDQYTLKDDLKISPIMQIQMGRSDQFESFVYFEQGAAQVTFKVVIYRQTCGSKVDYYVDLIPA